MSIYTITSEVILEVTVDVEAESSTEAIDTVSDFLFDNSAVIMQRDADEPHIVDVMTNVVTAMALEKASD